eukprot:5317035-Pyramimonas_sp.AAC.1
MAKPTTFSAFKGPSGSLRRSNVVSDDPARWTSELGKAGYAPIRVSGLPFPQGMTKRPHHDHNPGHYVVECFNGNGGKQT